MIAQSVPLFLSTEQIISNVTKVVDRYKDNHVFNNPSFEKGLLGFSIFNLYLAHSNDDAQRAEIAQNYIIRGLDSLNLTDKPDRILTSSVDYFLSQIGRYLHFIEKNELLQIDCSSYLEKIDQILGELLKAHIEKHNFDFGAGAIAAGSYFLTRLGRIDNVEANLSLLIRGIHKSAKIDNDGDYYWTSPTYFNRVYLGLSHGSAMIISFVSSILALGIEEDLCQDILEKAINFLLKQYRSTEYKGLFPNMVGEKIENMQFSLCYGDLGIGFALLKADRVLKNERYKNACDAILQNCLTRTLEDKLTLDASIYYGASGIGIAFEKIGEMTQNTAFGNRAEYWFSSIKDYAIYGKEYAGFQTRLNRQEESWDLFNVSFGFGVIGIGLTLMRLKKPALPSLAGLTFLA